MSSLTLTMAFLMGFTGSLHCAGMCGPILMIMPFQAFDGAKRALAMVLYHFGRISVYASLALILHSFRSLFDPKVQQYLSITLGGVLLILGVLSFIPGKVLKVKVPWAEMVKKQLGNIVGRPGLGAITLSGVLNGLLPCGLVYMALSASMAASTSLQTVLLIYSFGLGTIPMLIGISLLRSKLVFLRSTSVRKLVPVMVFAFGFLFVLRGLNLGIPYLSPKVEVAEHEVRSCCSKHKH